MAYVEGLIRTILFYKEDSGYTVLKCEIIDTTEVNLLYHEPTIVISGFFPPLESQVRYRFYGEFIEHPKYGLQYKANRFERMMENTKEGIIEYLSSGLFKGIGPKTAKRIVDTLGLDCLDQIVQDINILDNIKKIPAAKKQEIYNTLVKNRELERTLIWLYGFEISPKMSMRIVQKYGYKTIDSLKSNPYVLIDDVEGIGFKRADEIGLKMGFAFDSPLRIRAVIYYLLTEYMNKYGDTLLDRTKLIEYTQTFLNRQTQEVELELITSTLQVLIEQEKLVEIGDVIMLKALYDAEVELAKKVRQYRLPEEVKTLDPTTEEAFSLFEQNQAIQYTKDQRNAILDALLYPMVVITGGPGTGKTTIIKAIVELFERTHSYQKAISQKIKLVAPTGKAAKRLSEATAREATTIHRLLGYDFLGNFEYHEDNLLDCELLIIDETSMMDIFLAKQLFLALPTSCKIIIVGDEEQLPSVGPGQVLADIIASNICPVVHLDKIHRQAADSRIIDFAYRVLHQDLDESMFQSSPELRFLRSKESEILPKITQVLKQAIHDGYDLFEDIQILVPIYKGQAGIDAINEHIQQTFNHAQLHSKISAAGKTFCLNDKVIQLVNQAEDGIMNGDIGKVVTIVEDVEMVVDFAGNRVRIHVKDFENVALAYAVSVHKSQGSEFKLVVFLLLPSHWMMLKRKLIYTAITRAKESLILIGEPYTLRQGVMGLEPTRNTLLAQWLKEEIDVTSVRTLTLADFAKE